MKNRILFVDDEPNILSGFRRMLRVKRDDWDMEFAGSGEEALSAMQEQPYDVVVTDMKMPGMNGAKLLEHVKHLFPRTIRIVLSGHSNRIASLLSVSVAHQFLSKPLVASSLISVVSRACNLSKLVEDPALRTVLGSIADLPLRPEVFCDLTQVIADGDSVNRIEEIVECDAALSAKLLQLANSSFFGIYSPTTSARKAVAYVGPQTLGILITKFNVVRPYEAKDDEAAQSLEVLHSESAIAARVARRIIERTELREEAYLAGLLHNVGRLLSATSFSKCRDEIVRYSSSDELSIYEFSENNVERSQAKLGAYLLGLWGLPQSIVDAVAYYQNPSSTHCDSELSVRDTVHVAVSLIHEQTYPAQQPTVLDESYIESIGKLERVDSWREIVSEEIRLSSNSNGIQLTGQTNK